MLGALRVELERADEGSRLGAALESDGAVQTDERVGVQTATQGEEAELALVADLGEDEAQDRGRKADEAVLEEEEGVS